MVLAMGGHVVESSKTIIIGHVVEFSKTIIIGHVVESSKTIIIGIVVRAAIIILEVFLTIAIPLLEAIDGSCCVLDIIRTALIRSGGGGAMSSHLTGVILIHC